MPNARRFNVPSQCSTFPTSTPDSDLAACRKSCTLSICLILFLPRRSLSSAIISFVGWQVTVPCRNPKILLCFTVGGIPYRGNRSFWPCVLFSHTTEVLLDWIVAWMTGINDSDMQFVKSREMRTVHSMHRRRLTQGRLPADNCDSWPISLELQYLVGVP